MRKRVASATAIERDIWKDGYRPAMKGITKRRCVVDRTARVDAEVVCSTRECDLGERAFKRRKSGY